MVDTHEGKLYFDTTWTQPWSEVSRIRNHHNELKVSVEETTNPNRKFTLAKTVPGRRARLGLRSTGPAMSAGRECDNHKEGSARVETYGGSFRPQYSPTVIDAQT